MKNKYIKGIILFAGICIASVLIVAVKEAYDYVSRDVIQTQQAKSNKAIESRIQGGDSASVESIIFKTPFDTASFKDVPKAPLSPVLISMASGRYKTIGDVLSSSTSRVRREQSVLIKGMGNTPIVITIGGKYELKLPELPTVMSSVTAYTVTHGVIPVYSNMQWGDIVNKTPETWLKALNTAKMTKIDAYVLKNTEQNIITSYRYDGENALFSMELITDKDKKTSTEKVISAMLLMSSPEGEKMLDSIEATEKNALHKIYAMRKPETIAGISWRMQTPIADYKVEESSGAYGMNFVMLNSRTFLGTDAKVMSSRMDIWNMIPVGYTTVMLDTEWEQIKEDTVKKITGSASPANDNLYDGIKGSSGMFIKVEPSESNGKKTVTVSIVDKDVDNLIIDIYEELYSTPVKEIREKMSKDIKTTVFNTKYPKEVKKVSEDIKATPIEVKIPDLNNN